MCEKFLASDDAVKIISNNTEKQAVLDFISKDVWIEPYIFECFLKDIPNAPLFLSQYAKDFEVEKSDMKIVVPALENTEEELAETARQIGFLIAFPKDGRYVVYPTRYTAFSTICARAGISGTTICNSEQKPLLDVLPLYEKAQWLTRGFSLHKGSCKILYRDGKVSSMLSKEYEILPANEIVPAFERIMTAEHPAFAFKSGSFSHEYLVLDYLLNDSVMEDSFRYELEKYNVHIDTLTAGVRFSTSDIGNSKVTATPFYILNGETIMLCGGKVAVSHDSGHTKDSFIDELDKLALLFTESEDRVEELGNMDIKHPSGCFRHIIEKNKILKSGSDDVASRLDDEFPAGCTAIDIYLALNSIIDVRNSKKQLSPTQLIQLSESIAKLMFLNYSDYDRIWEDE